MSVEVERLAHYLKNAIEEAAKKGASQRGQISGSSVLINGVAYPYAQGFDCELNQGDYVWVVLDESGTTGVVVGK